MLSEYILDDMTIVAVISSPRKNGNTATIVKAIADSARANGKDVIVYSLNEMKHKMGCQGCRACKKKGYCTFKDDVSPVLDAIRDCEALIVSSPVYMNNFCSQYRTLADRFYSFVSDPNKTVNIAPGKKCVCVTSTGATGAEELALRMENQLKRYGFVPSGRIAFVSPNAGKTAQDDAEVMAKAAEIGRNL